MEAINWSEVGPRPVTAQFKTKVTERNRFLNKRVRLVTHVQRGQLRQHRQKVPKNNPGAGRLTEVEERRIAQWEGTINTRQLQEVPAEKMPGVVAQMARKG